MGKKLPLTEPIVSVYSNIANAQGILLNYQQGKIWIAQNFINYVAIYDKRLKEIKPHFIPISDIYLGGNFQMFTQNIFFPNLRTYAIPKKIVNESGNIISYIKKNIDDDYYVSLFINRRFIKNSGHASDFVHETFIYGYDDDEQIIYFCDYFRGASYKQYLCSYRELEEAYEFCDDYYIAENKKIPIHSIMAYTYVEDHEISLDKQRIKNSLQTYLNAKDLNCNFRFLHTSLALDSVNYWGINSYDGFIRYIIEKFERWDMPSSKEANHLQHLSDHKKSLYFTIKILYENGLANQRMIEDAQILVKKSVILRNKFIKFRLQGKAIEKQEVKQIVQQIMDLKVTEEKLLEELGYSL